MVAYGNLNGFQLGVINASWVKDGNVNGLQLGFLMKLHREA